MNKLAKMKLSKVEQKQVDKVMAKLVKKTKINSKLELVEYWDGVVGLNHFAHDETIYFKASTLAKLFKTLKAHKVLTGV